MFNSRKGVSEVVANILIVLLVIVGIAVIWSVVKPTIDKGAKGIQGDCFTVQVQPVSCSGEVGSWDVSVKRGPGAGNLEAVELIFEDETGSIKRIESVNLLDIQGILELETKLQKDVDDQLAGTKIKVNTVLKVNGQLCQITSQPIDCK